LRSDGLRYAEIADVLSISPGTVAALLARCNSRVQQILEPEGTAKDQYAS
jgi:DNA-directed RNA polymerase specialized sigma24 family protein